MSFSLLLLLLLTPESLLGHTQGSCLQSYSFLLSFPSPSRDTSR